MKKSQQLHQLIHSMSKSEKRYFKINSNREGSIYVKVFDLIIDQNVYDLLQLKQFLIAEKISS